MKEEIKKELLTKLKHGTISKAEQKSLEIAALDDPFLFDAIEGYSTVAHEDTENKMKTVFDRIDKKIVNEKPVRKFPIFLMAAAASLLILLGFFLFQNKNTEVAVLADNQPKEEVKQLEKQVENPSNEIAVLPSPKESPKIIKEKPNEVNSARSENSNIETNIKIEEKVVADVVVEEVKVADFKENDDKDGNADDVAFTTSPAPIAQRASRAEENQSQTSRIKKKESNRIVISGKVYNEKGEVLSNVAVITQKESAYTNIDGGFELTLDNQKQFIVFADKDYETSSIYANEDETDLKIYLKKIEVKSKDDAEDFTLFSEAVDHRFLTYIEDKEINVYNYITVFFKYEDDGNVSDIIVHNCPNYNLEDMIKMWIRDYQNLLPKSERGDVLKMLLIPD